MYRHMHRHIRCHFFRVLASFRDSPDDWATFLSYPLTAVNTDGDTFLAKKLHQTTWKLSPLPDDLENHMSVLQQVLVAYLNPHLSLEQTLNLHPCSDSDPLWSLPAPSSYVGGLGLSLTFTSLPLLCCDMFNRAGVACGRRLPVVAQPTGHADFGARGLAGGHGARATFPRSEHEWA